MSFSSSASSSRPHSDVTHHRRQQLLVNPASTDADAPRRSSGAVPHDQRDELRRLVMRSLLGHSALKSRGVMEAFLSSAQGDATVARLAAEARLGFSHHSTTEDTRSSFAHGGGDEGLSDGDGGHLDDDRHAEDVVIFRADDDADADDDAGRRGGAGKEHHGFFGSSSSTSLSGDGVAAPDDDGVLNFDDGDDTADEDNTGEVEDTHPHDGGRYLGFRRLGDALNALAQDPTAFDPQAVARFLCEEEDKDRCESNPPPQQRRGHQTFVADDAVTVPGLCEGVVALLCKDNMSGMADTEESGETTSQLRIDALLRLLAAAPPADAALALFRGVSAAFVATELAVRNKEWTALLKRWCRAAADLPSRHVLYLTPEDAASAAAAVASVVRASPLARQLWANEGGDGDGGDGCDGPAEWWGCALARRAVVEAGAESEVFGTIKAVTPPQATRPAVLSQLSKTSLPPAPDDRVSPPALDVPFSVDALHDMNREALLSRLAALKHALAWLDVAGRGGAGVNAEKVPGSGDKANPTPNAQEPAAWRLRRPGARGGSGGNRGRAVRAALDARHSHETTADEAGGGCDAVGRCYDWTAEMRDDALRATSAPSGTTEHEHREARCRLKAEISSLQSLL